MAELGFQRPCDPSVGHVRSSFSTSGLFCYGLIILCLQGVVFYAFQDISQPLWPLPTNSIHCLKMYLGLVSARGGKGQNRDSAFERRVITHCFPEEGGTPCHVRPAAGGSTRAFRRQKDRGESICRGGMGESEKASLSKLRIEQWE